MTKHDDQIIALAKAGHPPRAIARMLPLDPAYIQGRISQARNQGIDIPRFTSRAYHETTAVPRPKDAPLRISNSISISLQRHAAEAGLTPGELATQILENHLLGVCHD